MAVKVKFDVASLKPPIHYLVIKVGEVQEKSEKGLYIPQETQQIAQGASVIGRVVAIGPTAWIEWKTKYGMEPPVKVGELVLYKQFGGEVYHNVADNGLYRFVNDVDVLTPVNEGAEFVPYN